MSNKEIEKAKIVKLCDVLVLATANLRAGVPSPSEAQTFYNNVVAELTALRDNSTVLDHKNIIRDAILAAANAVVSGALEDLARVASELAPAAEGFRYGRDIAIQGKKDLFLPWLAANAAQLLDTAQKLKEVAEEIEAVLSGDHELKALADDLRSIYNKVSALKTVIS